MKMHKSFFFLKKGVNQQLNINLKVKKDYFITKVFSYCGFYFCLVIWKFDLSEPL